MTISVGVPTAPPALPVLHMMEAGLLGENVTIDLNVWNSPEELLAMVQGGEHDLYAFPPLWFPHSTTRAWMCA